MWKGSHESVVKQRAPTWFSKANWFESHFLSKFINTQNRRESVLFKGKKKGVTGKIQVFMQFYNWTFYVQVVDCD